MSNAVVGELYGAIINEVTETARNDFQEEGYDESTLQEFRALWMAKVAGSGTASFPWVPKQQAPAPLHDTMQRANGALGHEAPGPITGNPLAAIRAAQQIQQLAVRNGDIEQSQADNAIGMLMQQAQAHQARQNHTIGEDSGKAFPGNVKEEDKELVLDTSPKKRALSEAGESVSQQSIRPKKTRRADIDLDDEAINSDLDDSDDDALNSGNEAEGDEGDMQTVLCLYDKVARTKNKWKCVLKDGLVSLNGRDYAFSKANGEFEW
ncbi:transcription factor IIA, alpha/beta subunit [Protomyces lactucae-debilis]|uniref:Transcription factor IIA, alpha/beta subunit n=1 Tax=Protomyces lactucae-debilis TaxID=2754530 RepID=A0A1Y2FBN0_PROLT|nr:transcription factor IIA, alpha/beta subunit [Protomyces lactucae-debilis]ORY81027.1 transcription factor IIA, alpha/beta subunit [Protomyces lactucae-debilis]